MKYKLASSLIFFFLLTTVFSQTFNKAKMDSFFSVLSSKDKAMGSLTISKNGVIFYNNAIGYASITGQEKTPATIKTKYRVGSITKMFTAVIIFQLIEENKLTLDITLDKYFPVIPNASKISIGNLLNHRSGIHNFTDDSLYLTYNEHPQTQQQMLDIIVKSAPDFEPGSQASYSNSNFILLGYIAEKISGKTYSQLVQERIVKKLNLTDTYVGAQTNIKKNESYSYRFVGGWAQEPETDMSVPGGAGNILSTTDDLTRFIEGLFAGKLVSAASLDKMKTLNDNYGMAMFQIPFYTKKAYGHNGGIDGFSSMLGYFQEDSVAFAYCTNGQVYPANDIIIGVLSIYFNYPYTIPAFNTITVESNELEKYVGVYSSLQIPLKITITKENASLIAQATGQKAFTLEAMGKDIFQFEKVGAVFEFNPVKNEFILKQGGGEFLFTKEK